MAAVTSMALDREQLVVLIDALKGVANTSIQNLQGMQTACTQLMGDEVLGDSAQKGHLVETMTKTNNVFIAVSVKLQNVVKLADRIGQEVGIAAQQNNRSSEENANAVHAHAQKLKENMGESGANI